jgi:glucose-1-phosphate thymidylyltransferase
VTPSKAVVLARDPSAPALMSVANRPLLRHALEWLEDGGIRQVAIVASASVVAQAREAVGRRSDWSFDTSWLVQLPGESLGESLAALSGFLDGDPFVLHLADSLAKQSLPFLLGDVDADYLGAVVLTHGEAGGIAPVVDIRSRRNGRHPRPLERSSAAGVGLVGAGILATTAALDASPGRELNALADHVSLLGGTVHVQPAEAWWRVGQGAETVLDGNRFALETLRGEPVVADVVDSRIQGAVSIHPTASLESSVVRGPAVIGAGACVRSAYVGPYTSIGENAMVEGAEIEHSILLAGASVSHLGARLEASIIGPGARVFRDFRLPRAIRMNIGQGAEVALT